MLNATLYDKMVMQAPVNGMHENAEYITADGKQGFATHLQNFVLSNNTVKMRCGTKEIFSFLRKDQVENILGYSPKEIKIRDVQFYKNDIWFLYFEKISPWMGIVVCEDLDDNRIRLHFERPEEYKQVAIQKGSLHLSFHYRVDGHEIIHIEVIDTFEQVSTYTYDEDARHATITFNPILKSENVYYTSDDLKDVRLSTGELVMFSGGDIAKNDENELRWKMLGTRGYSSSASNEQYFIFATGIDPIIVYDSHNNNFATPICYVERRLSDESIKKGDEEIDFKFYPVVTSLLYYNNKFFGICVNEKGETSTDLAYTKHVLSARNWFEDTLLTPLEGIDPNVTRDVATVSKLTLDVSSMHKCVDSLLSINAFENDLVFIGKQKAQMWQRGSFLTKDGEPDKVRIASMKSSEGLPLEIDSYKVHLTTLTAQWKKTYDIGAISQGCIVQTDLGIFLVSKGGVRLIAYNKNYVNPIIEIHSIGGIDKILSTYFNHEKSRPPTSFSYSIGGLFGFRFGSTCLVGHIENNTFLGWSSFTNSFSADRFTTDFNGNLVMFRDEFDIYPTISLYNDAKSPLKDFYEIKYHEPEARGTESFCDQIWEHKEDMGDYSVSDSYIDIEFTVAIDAGRKFACKYMTIIADYYSSMIVDSGNKVEFVVGSDLPNVSYVNTDISSEPVSGYTPSKFRWVGDTFYTLRITNTMMSDTGAAPLIERCKFVGERFKLGIIGSLRYTNFKFKKIELFGSIEGGSED